MEIGESIKEFEQQLREYRIPRYEELPDIELYMDQVIALLNKNFRVLSNDETFLTPSMINNYVKFGLIPAPQGKRYSRRHLCYMIALSFLKQILSMSEIKTLETQMISLSNELNAYNLLCSQLENAFQSCCNQISNDFAGVPPEHLSLAYCAQAIANKLHAQKIIEITFLAQESKDSAKPNKKSD